MAAELFLNISGDLVQLVLVYLELDRHLLQTIWWLLQPASELFNSFSKYGLLRGVLGPDDENTYRLMPSFSEMMSYLFLSLLQFILLLFFSLSFFFSLMERQHYFIHCIPRQLFGIVGYVIHCKLQRAKALLKWIPVLFKHSNDLAIKLQKRADIVFLSREKHVKGGRFSFGGLGYGSLLIWFNLIEPKRLLQVVLLFAQLAHSLLQLSARALKFFVFLRIHIRQLFNRLWLWLSESGEFGSQRLYLFLSLLIISFKTG